MTLPEPPHGWGSDNITNYIDNVRQNSFATYVKYQYEYRKLAEVDKIYRTLIDNLINTRDWFVALFLLRAHSAYLSSSHLAMSGQTAETYVLLRSCIENGLYGLHIFKNPSLGEIWLKRHDSEESKRQVKNEFLIGKLFSTFDAYDSREARIAKGLYDWCIDFGGHPNESAITQSLKMDETIGTIKFELAYLSGDATLIRSCLKTAAQVGASVLGIFKIIYKDRFNISGLSDNLDKARKGL